MLRPSRAHLSSEYFAECDFVNFMAEYQMGFASKRYLQGCPRGNRLGKNSSSNLQKHTTKSQQSNRLLSATKEWTTTVIRAQSKSNRANNKQMESQTNHN